MKTPACWSRLVLATVVPDVPCTLPVDLALVSRVCWYAIASCFLVIDL